MVRNIEDVLNFRNDISPFLVHLTRANNGVATKDILRQIICSKTLLQSKEKISDVRFGCIDVSWDEEKKNNLFSAICFTETPLNEIHCLLEIKNRRVNLEPFGLVFIKSNLKNKNVAPVLYLNNYGGLMDNVIYSLGDLVFNPEYNKELNKIFPLFSVFGNKIHPKNADKKAIGQYDFSWEREWRLPYCYGNFSIDFSKDVFVGLCPHDDIEEFENIIKEKTNENIPFIDPTRNAKWYATKLIERRKYFDMTVSVV